MLNAYEEGLFSGFQRPLVESCTITILTTIGFTAQVTDMKGASRLALGTI